MLASDAVRELAGATEGVAFGFRRVERLKGFDKPVGVVEIHPGERAPARDFRRRAKRALGGTRPRLRLLVAAGLVAVGVAVAVPLTLLGGGGGKTAASPFEANTIGLLDAKTLKPAGSLDQFGSPFAMWRDPNGYVWAGASYGGGLVRIDPRTQQATTTVQFGIDVGSVGFGAGSVWIGDDDNPAVNRYDATYGTLTKRIALPYTKGQKYDYPGFTEGVAFAAGSLWVGYGKYQFRVARIDPATNRITKIFDFPHSDGPPLLAFGDRSLWIVTIDRGNVYRIDPRTNQVAMHTKLHGGPVSDIAIVDGYAWMPVQGDGAVWQVDRNGNVLRSFATGAVPITLGAANGRVYVANEQSGSISRIDPATGTVTTVRVGHNAETAIVVGGRVWVSLTPSTSDVTGGLPARSTVRVSTVGSPYFTTDPAIYSQGNVQLQEAIGARLLRTPDVAQATGATLLPEIADLPTVSNHGRTYTLRIRSGWRFSPPSNAPVTAEVMRYSIERALSPKFTQPAFGSAMVQDLVGAQQYLKGKAPHVAGIRVAGDQLSFTLTAPDPDFPARISQTFFRAVPLGTPVVPHGIGSPIPSAGPYYIAGNPGNTIVLKRNPNYRGPRPHHLAAIVISQFTGTSAPEDVAANKGDYAWTDVNEPASLVAGGPLDRRLGAHSAAAKTGDQRYFAPPAAGVRVLEFNSMSGIFRSARLREAVNYALDRPALAAATNDVPSDDPVPPGIPGSRGGKAIYPLAGPDLAKARALAGSAHRRAVLFMGTPQSCPYCTSLASTVEGDLARIGISVQVKPFDDPFGAAQKPQARWDMMPFGWSMDYPDPSDFVNELFDGGRQVAGLSWSPQPWIRNGDTRYLERMRAAYVVQEPARAGVYRRLVENMFRVSPPGAVYATMSGTPQIFSSRVGCEVFRPQDSGLVDLAALCLHGKS